MVIKRYKEDYENEKQNAKKKSCIINDGDDIDRFTGCNGNPKP